MKKTMQIIDGNNWFRRKAETSIKGNPLRQCYNEIQNSPYDVVLLVWDGYFSLKARRAIYPEYKAKRAFAGESIYEYQKVFKQVAQHSRAIIFEVEGYEGDDVVAKLAQMYRKEYDIKIESNDADFAQLGLPMARDTFKIEPKWVTLYKTLVGDSSDNIKGIPGFGQSAWDKLDDKARLKLVEFCKGGELDIGLQGYFSKGAWLFLITVPNQIMIRNYWKIVNFLPIDDTLLFKSMRHGNYNQQEAEKIFKEYMA
jgi:hypothetical protein